MIAARAVTLRAGRRLLLDDISLELRPGEVLALVGPNGAGKSSLLRILSGERQPDVGAVAVAGRPLAAWRPLDLARRRAVVSQTAALSFPMTAADVVALGRLPWHGTPEARRDAAAVAASLAAAQVAHLAAQPHVTLSGGERQRVQLGRALAQLDGAERPAALLLDEPTASLDVRHAALLLRLVRRLASEGLGILMVLHDLNEAAFVADRVAVFAAGRLVALGPPAEVLDPTRIEGVYGLGFRTVSGGGVLPIFGTASGG